MSGKNQVEFLLEIMKGSTTTKQEQADYDPQVDGVCGGHCDVEDIMAGDEAEEAEVREQPPKSTSPRLSKSSPSKPNSAPEGVWVVRDFDFYGNPISEKMQPGRHNTPNNLTSLHQTTTVSPANSSNRQVARRQYTTEFPDGSTAPSCLVDFSMCFMNSLICSAGPCMLQDANADDKTSKSRPMCGTTHEDTAIAKIEAELQLELEKIRKQKIEMEQWYRREIARQDADKTLLQIQMEQKIVSMMEARIHLENEYRKEIANEITEVRTLVNTQLDLGSRSDVSDVVDVTEAVVITNQLETSNETSIPSTDVSITTEQRKPIPSASVMSCETKTSCTKSSTLVLSGTDEDSSIDADNNVIPHTLKASE